MCFEAQGALGKWCFWAGAAVPPPYSQSIDIAGCIDYNAAMSGIVSDTFRTRTRYFDYASAEEPFVLSNGERLEEVTVAYECYGELNANADNAVLVFHALTGSQHAAGYNPVVERASEYWTEECHYGWWDAFVGPGRALDTERYFVVCANYIGGCYGSTGPATVMPGKSIPYGNSFPAVNATDVVESQLRLLDYLGIARLHAVVGASSGGMLALNLAVRYPHRVHRVIPIAAGLDADVLQQLHILEQIFAIEGDGNFSGGDYYNARPPSAGLMLARMISHKSFVSLQALTERASREVRDFRRYFSFHTSLNALESYMLHQGEKFATRFDANAYLRILEMWLTFDLLKDCGADSYGELFARCSEQRYLVFSISSDVCFYPDRQDALVRILKGAKVPVTHITVHSDKGHDSFLLEPELYYPYVRYILER